MVMKTSPLTEVRVAPRRRVRRIAGVAAAVALALAALLLAGLLLRSQGTTQPAPTTRPAPASVPQSAPSATSLSQPFTATSARSAYVALQRRRGEAFVKADPSILRSVYTATSPNLSTDIRNIQAERDNGYHLERATIEVRKSTVTGLDAAAHTAQLVVQVDLGTARYVDQAGSVRYQERSKGVQTFHVTMLWSNGQWRIAQVVQ
jgi:hypothetical protein